jgi:serine/threonine protein kinase
MQLQPDRYTGRPLADLLDDLPAVQPKTSRLRLGRVRGVGPDSSTTDDPLATRPGSLLPVNPATVLPVDHPAVEVPGVVLERYLAGGSQGWVYAGRVRATRRLVAVKILPRCDGEAPTSAVQEVLICARVRHRNVLRVFHVEPINGFLAVIMELVQGRELGSAGLQPTNSYPCFGQLCDALTTLADNHIVHRDIKPQNIVVRQDGSPVVVDFGLAVDLEFAGSTATKFVGTPYFMAPDALSNADPDPVWDAYSLGVTAAFVLCGEQKVASDLFILQRDKRSGAFDRRIAESLTGLPDDLRPWITELISPASSQRKAALAAGRKWTAQ